MLRRKTPKPDNAAGLAFPKRRDGKTRNQEKDALKMSERLVRLNVGWQVWGRSGVDADAGAAGLCDLCGQPFQSIDDGEQHEDPSRAKTRNKPPTERFNRHNTARAHGVCHRQITENRQRVEFDDPVLRFDGKYTVRRVKDSAILFRMGRRRGRCDGEHAMPRCSDPECWQQ